MKFERKSGKRELCVSMVQYSGKCIGVVVGVESDSSRAALCDQSCVPKFCWTL
jgi:hypothetical protein